jgi:hypothetical protein
MSRKLIITGVRTGVAVMVLSVSLAWASSGHQPTDPTAASHSQTLRFVVPPPRPQDQKSIDVAPHGLSLGDEVVGAVSLKRDGHLVGRGLSECTITDATFEGQQCTLDLVLQRGVITAKIAGLDRPLPHQTPSPNDVFAVTGGTGQYTGADGTITIIHGANADTFVVQLSE